MKWRLRAYRLAAKRRLALALHGTFDPYPPADPSLRLSPSAGHFPAYDRAPLALHHARLETADFGQWQQQARAKLIELLGVDPHPEPPQLILEEQPQNRGDIVTQRFYLRPHGRSDIPVTLVWSLAPGHPAASAQVTAPARPVLVYLAGSTSGVHIAWGESRVPADPLRLGIGADMARQAARRGYLVVCIEQAGFGEREERAMTPRSATRCIDAANHALLLGRTLLGERVADVRAVIDYIQSPDSAHPLECGAIHIFGHSAGGATAIYAAAIDPGLDAVIASGSLGFIRATIARRRDPEGQAVVPGILNWLEMDDIVSLIAPRPFMAISGEHDHIYPFAGAKAVTDAARDSYAKLGAPDHIGAWAGPEGHRYYPEQTWTAIADMLGMPPQI
ncbi:MAG: alpha/beta hydrolase family protein [Alphaproteobacteria bacterium]